VGSNREPCSAHCIDSIDSNCSTILRETEIINPHRKDAVSGSSSRSASIRRNSATITVEHGRVSEGHHCRHVLPDGRGHVHSKHDVVGPHLEHDLPPLELRQRDELVEIRIDLERLGFSEAEDEVIQDRSAAPGRAAHRSAWRKQPLSLRHIPPST